jgi:hypothetical protein
VAAWRNSWFPLHLREFPDRDAAVRGRAPGWTTRHWVRRVFQPGSSSARWEALCGLTSLETTVENANGGPCWGCALYKGEIP